MRKVIAIGESSYDIIFKEGNPQTGFPGGRILNAAATLSEVGITTTMVSECGADYFGDLIVKFLEAHGVITGSIDRFTDGVTSTSVIYETGRVCYGKYPIDRFDVVWPRIDEDDIILFGSFYSVDNAQRERLFELIKYAEERKAIIIYLPGFHRDLNFRITKVMTAILENLELSNLVIANSSDMESIFGKFDAETIFKKKIEFYCPNFVYLYPNRDVTVYAQKNSKKYDSIESEKKNQLGWSAGFIAGICYGLMFHNIKHDDMKDMKIETWDNIMETAVKYAVSASTSGTNTITSNFGKEMKTALDAALSDIE